MKLSALDHTLGHDPERHELVFTADDRLAIARRLDRLGIDYIDAGCPAADRRAREFFERARQECHLQHASLVASVRMDAIRESLARDTGIQAAVDAATPAIAISSCCWHAGPIGLQEYCRRIGETVRYFKSKGRTIIFRADDFFDGYCTDPSFALHMLEAAKGAGADVLCLCDSSGGTLPHVLREVCLEVRKRFDGVLGIRAHDDRELACANTLEAVEQGFTHIEGSLNAYGRHGKTANLCSIINNLEYKLGHTVIGPDNLEAMPGVARFIGDAGLAVPRRQPMPDPEALLRSVDERLVSRLRARERLAVLDRIRLLESMGYRLQAARGTLELLAHEALAPDHRPFEAERYEVTSHFALFGEAITTASVTIRVGDGIRSETEEGTGPVDALERALRQCLFAVYPAIADVRLKEYHAHTLEPAQGGAARIRLTIEWAESGERWITSGVSSDLIEAAWVALVDGFRLPLMRLEEHAAPMPRAVTDSSWAV
ncbi:MAG TPA: alpha-isopropylmalate synthase regulatory domain-containing protein [Bryobacteraceae bacterium]|nr:alpha-isopropylmalate synthase regulatory domain-containing protein [Bryobacteraceae bacterium]